MREQITKAPIVGKSVNFDAYNDHKNIPDNSIETYCLFVCLIQY